ncbi:MAG: carboxymuconolactone decarboxylase family protein [Thermoplasmatota archaeon]
MDETAKELAGIAASIAGHCRPCFRHHLKKAKELEVPMDDINEVVMFARDISAAGDEKMYAFASKRLQQKRGENI